MASNRLVFHPILVHRRSRFIFFVFLIVAASVGTLSWFKFEAALFQAGLSSSNGAPSGNFLLSIFLSPYFRWGVVFATAVMASGLTAQYVVGAVRRIEQWLMDYERDLNPKPLRTRAGDKFSKLASLINQLCPYIEKD